MTQIQATPHQNNFGARIDGLNLSKPLAPETVEIIRQLWIDHQIIYFPNQILNHCDLERFTRYFGDFGTDPYIKPVSGHTHILEIRREPDEAIAPFGASWHSDWSFQATPPSATLLHAKVIPPIGGDTLYADGIRAFAALDIGLKKEIEQLTALHSARRPYSHEGFARNSSHKRSMTITPDDNAWDVQVHPLVRTHPESGHQVLWINPVYTIGIKDIDEAQGCQLLSDLFAHALAPQFIYRHKWSANMLTMWDNRSAQHCAQGGYDGHLRILHRTTVAGDSPV